MTDAASAAGAWPGAGARRVPALALASVLALAIGAAAAWAGLVAVGPVLAIAAIAGLAAVLVAFDDPDWALAILCVVTYLNLSEIAVGHHGAPSIAKAVVAAGLGLAFLRWAVTGMRPGWSWTAVAAVAGFGAVKAASIPGAEFPAVSVAGFADFVRDVVICFTVILLLNRPRAIFIVLWSLIAAAGLTATITVVQVTAGLEHVDFLGLGKGALHHIAGEVDDWRVHGPLDDPNYYAQLLLLGLPLAIDRMLRARPPLARLLAAAVAGLLILAIVFTASRGALIALLGLLAVTTVVYGFFVRAAVVAAVVAVVAMPLLPAAHLERAASVLEVIEQVGSPGQAIDRSVAGRIDEQRVGLAMFEDAPVLGVGLGNYEPLFQTYTTRLGLTDRFEEREAHNLYLEIAAETGAAGLAAFAALWLAILHAHALARRRFLAAGRPDLATAATAFLLGLVGHGLAAIFLHEAWPRSWWMMIGIVLALPFAARHLPAMRTAGTIGPAVIPSETR